MTEPTGKPPFTRRVLQMANGSVPLKWVITALWAVTLLLVGGWATAVQSNMADINAASRDQEGRLAQLEEYKRATERRLERMEDKLDLLVSRVP